MKKYFEFYLNSFKQSAIHKPSALILLIIVFCTITVVSSVFSRLTVSEFKREHDTPNYYNFSLSSDTFIDNYLEIGSYISENKEKYSFNGDTKLDSFFRFNINDTTIKINDNEKLVDIGSIKMSITSNEYIREENIAKSENIMYVSDNIRKKLSIQENDRVTIYGSEFIVKGICSEDNIFLLPYSITFKNTPKINTVYGYVNNVTHYGVNKFVKNLENFGCEIEKHTINIALLQGFIFLIAILSICTLSSVTVLNYCQKVNNKKYATYKILGAKPKTLAIAMIVETMLIAVLSIGLGLVFDAILGLNLVNSMSMSIAGYEWLHYLILCSGSFFSILILTIVKVVKRAKAVPIDGRYMV